VITGTLFTLAPWAESPQASSLSKVVVVDTVAFATTATSVNLVVDGVGGSSCQVFLSQRQIAADIDAQDTILVCDGVVHYSANGNYITISRQADGFSGLEVDVVVIGSVDEAIITS